MDEIVKAITVVDVHEWYKNTIDSAKSTVTELAEEFGINMEDVQLKFFYDFIFIAKKFQFTEESLSMLGLENHTELSGQEFDVISFELKLMEMENSASIVELRKKFYAMRYLSIKFEEYEMKFDHLTKFGNQFSPPESRRGKHRCVGLFRFSDIEWAFITCQRHSYRVAAETKRLQSNYGDFREIQKWENVSHSIDIVNDLKKSLKKLKWNVSWRFRIMTDHSNPIHTDAQLIAEVEKIIKPNVVETMKKLTL